MVKCDYTYLQLDKMLMGYHTQCLELHECNIIFLVLQCKKLEQNKLNKIYSVMYFVNVKLFYG